MFSYYKYAFHEKVVQLLENYFNFSILNNKWACCFSFLMGQDIYSGIFLEEKSHESEIN